MDATLSTWAAWQRAQGLSERTISERTATIRYLLVYAVTTPLELGPDHIIAFMGRKMKPATRATYHASIRAFCAWMQRTQQRPDNPADMTPRPRRPKSRPRPITEEQLQAVLAAANRDRTYTYVLLAARAGLRIHEVAKVHGSDIDLWTHELTVDGKGDSLERVPLHDDLIAEARKYPRAGYWFPAYSAQSSAPHVTEHAVGAAISGAMKRAGVVGTPHMLRHCFATSLVAAGVHFSVVQRLMRHKSQASTAIYTDVGAEQLREGISQLPGVSTRLAA